MKALLLGANVLGGLALAAVFANPPIFSLAAFALRSLGVDL